VQHTFSLSITFSLHLLNPSMQACLHEMLGVGIGLLPPVGNGFLPADAATTLPKSTTAKTMSRRNVI
jgi:hypothetical protein